ncbi:MAG: 23S rRNA (adenine(2503)-C(2))-methyltransferase RlmN [Candidatus Cloacimonetes bacterium]|nr:23S rRNA (adenine(2503)-C(2))-methyltransferase RlmN [Candidatus Cloacimonadota bacterium]
MLNSLYGINPTELAALIAKDFPAYRGKQLLEWIYKKLVFDPSLMTNLPPDFKAWLMDTFSLVLPTVLQKLESTDGTFKLLLQLEDGQKVECVLIPEGKKRTLCVSSQTGCSWRCAFCATGTMGKGRNLLPHEIVQQILITSQLIKPQILSNIVFMGMGEPLDNLDNVLAALKVLQDEKGMAFSPRRTTISTCGIVPGIVHLADSGIKAKLAVSLNSAIDKVRDQLMPVNRIYPLPHLKQALVYYKKKSPYRITFEYILIPDHNMDDASLKALRRFCGDIASKINFIPLNPTANSGMRAPTKAEIDSFMARAASLPQAITLRKSKGQDIQGACGQLALNTKPIIQGAKQ